MNETKFEQVLQVVQRPINCLVDQDRNKRKQGLSVIDKQIQKRDQTILKRLLTQTNLGKYLNRIIEDKIQVNRQMAFNIIEKCVNKLKSIIQGAIIDYFEILSKNLIQRINNTPFPQTSQELRLRIIQIINKLVILNYPIISNISQLSSALSKCLLDPYPQLKKNTCTLIITLSTNLKFHIGHHSVHILKSLATNLTHQHSKVRKTILVTLGSLLVTEGAANNFEHIQVGLKASLSDKIQDVRKSALQCVARLLNLLGPKYLLQYEATLVSYLLTGLSDQSQQNVNLAINLLTECGKKRKQLEIQENGQKMNQE